MTKMLVELLFCPLTFCGAPSGSDVKKCKTKFTKGLMTLDNCRYLLYEDTSAYSLSLQIKLICKESE